MNGIHGKPDVVGRVCRSAFVLLIGVSLTACDLDEILSIDDPEFVTDESLEDPNALPLVVRGAIAEFIRGYSGDGLANLGFLTATGLLTDELQSSDTFLGRNATDRRDLQAAADGNPSDLAYEGLQRARRATKDAAVAVVAVNGLDDPDLALMHALNGYSFVALAEGWCSAVPISNVVGGEFVYGDELTTEELLDSALVRFEQSVAAEANDLAAVGMGRALLDLGLYPEAAAAVSGVPDSYEYLLEHSENTFQNPVWNLNNDNIRFTILGNEGINGLDFRTAEDPRILVTRDGDRVGFDASTPLWEQQVYPNRDSDVPLASGIEARLIEAEAALGAGNPGAFIQQLNALRSTVSGLEPLEDPGTEAERVTLLFRERAFWLFLTGHRLGDLRRLVSHYGRDIESVYPIGTDTRRQPYGDDVVFSVPFEEEQNPLFDRSECVTTGI
ncbi:MAG: hypothetical protein GEU90_08900 [Gemmatimonas sp.]|nr:hypothetical protein [Gemmatimonas sp.]